MIKQKNILLLGDSLDAQAQAKAVLAAVASLPNWAKLYLEPEQSQFLDVLGRMGGGFANYVETAYYPLIFHVPKTKRDVNVLVNRSETAPDLIMVLGDSLGGCGTAEIINSLREKPKIVGLFMGVDVAGNFVEGLESLDDVNMVLCQPGESNFRVMNKTMTIVERDLNDT